MLLPGKPADVDPSHLRVQLLEHFHFHDEGDESRWSRASSNTTATPAPSALRHPAMLSPYNARPQQSARRAYVCLSCRLSTSRHHFSTDARLRISHDFPNSSTGGISSKKGNDGSRRRKVAPLPHKEHPEEPTKVLVDTTDHVVKWRSTAPSKLIRGHYMRGQSKDPKTNEWRPSTWDGVRRHVVRDRRIEKAQNSARTSAISAEDWNDDRRNDLEAIMTEHVDAQLKRDSIGTDRGISGRENAREAETKILEHDGEHSRTIDARPPRLTSSGIDSLLKQSMKRPTTDAKDATPLRTHVRSYHRQTEAPAKPQYGFPPPEGPNSVRAQLRQWQEDYGKEMEKLYEDKMPVTEEPADGISNNLTRLGDNNSFVRRSDEAEDEHHAIAHFARSSAEDFEDDATDPRFLLMGDLVEIEYPNSEKESMLAVFVRRVGPESQFYDMRGRWLNLPERNVQYSIPGWVSPELVEPLLQYLPDEEQTADREVLQQEAYVKDLSVPRSIAAPLVSRLVAFNRESLEIYRKHASTLDRAHDILSHDTDLRYGSLVSAATTLLKTPSDKLPLTALFTVRKALMHAGFAFNVDRRSHRLTGYLQIRSKEQVKNVEQVRGWLREWQNDLATMAAMTTKQAVRHAPSKGYLVVKRFIHLAKQMVEINRQNRDPTLLGNVGPSKTKREITPTEDAVSIHTDTRFNHADQAMVRFMEAWACSNMFMGLPRINALPPLILQATGLYDDYALSSETGYLFLQELGTILPYENRVRFDQHLLLPSSQHSKPLQALMNSLLSMANEPNLSDSMAHIRHDWGGLPVYCIDGASAQEIDDGISVERATHADSENPEWWVHIHIANPTAFFDREHPLAKMARHMGETIYTPERTYMMLPRWATQKHFSLAKDRPCLTFSARLNERGEILENKIRAGLIRNVHRLTPEETKTLVGLKDISAQTEIDISVGGKIPPTRQRTSAIPDMKQSDVDNLKILQKLAEKRQDVRKAAGGVFFDSHRPEMSVWQSWRSTGLAWDHPYRRGLRTIEGDPVINMKTRGLKNWFSAADGVTDILVREMMLLACEVSTEWCASRAIPTIFRGAVKKPNSPDPQEFYRTVAEPAMARNNGEMPLHIGIEYIKTQGSVILSTKPLRHNLLGLNHYGKVTSPLRRYGDMILHWQIEAALREEARKGTSLLAQGASLSGVKQPDRSFLPFSSQTLQTIMLGLQPREGMITRAKFYADSFWLSMLMFRAHHFGEAKLPFETCHAYVPVKPWQQMSDIRVIFEEVNVACIMEKPDKQAGLGLPAAQAGDRWECTLESVNVYQRVIRLKPFRLADRWE